MRICSLLPSATEIVCALGLSDNLVAITHECDYPPEIVARLPRITRSAVASDRLNSAEIDALVTRHLHDHRGIYTLDQELLERLNPDLILTQELCDVCAVSYSEVQEAVRALYGERTILSLEPLRLDDVFEAIQRVGTITGRAEAAAELVSRLRGELAAIAAAVAGAPRPRVACVEWIDPPWIGGHWVPDIVRSAGGEDALGRAGEPARRATWDEIAAAAPDVIVLMPCGFDVARTLREWPALTLPEGWERVPAARTGAIWAVNANAYFSRPGPRLVEGTRILAHILHPDRVAPPREADALQRLAAPAGERR
jgi:iron complex transport system substrate-binding protein